jgi:hypothetical protein
MAIKTNPFKPFSNPFKPFLGPDELETEEEDREDVVVLCQTDVGNDVGKSKTCKF